MEGWRSIRSVLDGPCGCVPASESVGGLHVLRSFARLVGYLPNSSLHCPLQCLTPSRLTRTPCRSSHQNENPEWKIKAPSSGPSFWSLISFFSITGKDCIQVVTLGLITLCVKCLVIKNDPIKTRSNPRPRNNQILVRCWEHCIQHPWRCLFYALFIELYRESLSLWWGKLAINRTRAKRMPFQILILTMSIMRWNRMVHNWMHFWIVYCYCSCFW